MPLPDSEISLNDRRWLELRFRLNQENLKKAFGHLRSAGIEPILIKGWAAARYYPVPWKRICTDVDLAVAPEDFDAAVVALDGEVARSWAVDLHRGLRHLDTVPWDDLFANSEIVELDGVGVRVLRPEDHLRVLVVHWLTDGGAHREKLDDIVHLVEATNGSFDWARCLETVSEIRRGWILRTLEIAAEFAGLAVEPLPIRDRLGSSPEWLRRSLAKEWRSGVPLKPLQTVLANRRLLWQQLRKRIPPNAIQASVESEAPFDDSRRWRIQLASMTMRFKPSAVRVISTLFGRRNHGN